MKKKEEEEEKENEAGKRVFVDHPGANNLGNRVVHQKWQELTTAARRRDGTALYIASTPTSKIIFEITYLLSELVFTYMLDQA
jgi:hypothetical protein